MAFKTIYDERVSCFSIRQCEDCGTVVFYYYDESWEKNFKCPTCTDYKTGYKFWTKEEIETDEGKQKIVDGYHWMKERENEDEARIKSRNGLYDWQLFKPKHFLKTKRGRWVFESHINSITNKNKLKGLRLELSYWKNDIMNEDGRPITFTSKKKYIVPCSFSAIRFCFKLLKRKKIQAMPMPRQ